MNKDRLLEGYISKSLIDQEHAELEKRIREDETFKSEVEWHKNMQAVVSNVAERSLRKQLDKYDEEITNETTEFVIGDKKTNETAGKRPTRFWAIAAAFLLLIGLGWIGLKLLNTEKSDLYAQNYETYPNTVYTITRGEEKQTNETLHNAFLAFEAKDYLKAAEYFKKQNESAELPAEYQFYYAQSLAEAYRYDEAKAVYYDIIKRSNVFLPESNWYLALIYLKEGNTVQAKTYLQNVIVFDGFKTKEAKKLLNALN